MVFGVSLIVGWVAAAPVIAGQVAVRGYFIYGPAVSMLQPCHSKYAYWVSETGPGAKALLEGYDLMTETDYETLYVEMQGNLAVQKTNVPEEYDGHFEVGVLRILRPKKSGDCS